MLYIHEARSTIIFWYTIKQKTQKIKINTSNNKLPKITIIIFKQSGLQIFLDSVISAGHHQHIHKLPS